MIPNNIPFYRPLAPQAFLDSARPDLSFPAKQQLLLASVDGEAQTFRWPTY